ncbi:MAG: SusC/RagA family TonB-linked outer membrane protein [Daejeonella sp.]
MKRFFTIISFAAFLLFCLTTITFAQERISVSGKVTDASSGESLIGVTVQLKGTTTGVTTDVSGIYSISVPPTGTLVFSYLGYIKQEVVVNNLSLINIQLNTSSEVLDQVVVVGYGIQRKLDVTGSVATLKGEEISKQASINPVSALQGKVAGVQITNSGAPGASPQIRIRGVGTIYGNSSPLYVVDGVWYDDMSFLNPADIDNISILKDASSQSIYGIRAANGVVLVTTKKGKKGTTAINYNAYAGYQTVTNQVQMANANEYAIMINELSGTNLLDAASFSKGTDWYGQILRDAMVVNNQISFNGGSEKTTYNLSLGYLKQDGNVKNNSYNRFTARLQNDFQALSNLKVGYNVSAIQSDSKDAPGGIFHQLYAAGPVVPVYYADGAYGDPSDYSLGDGNNFNPQVTLDFNNSKSQNYRLTGNAFAELKFLEHFTLKSSMGGEFSQAQSRSYNPVYVATLAQRNTASRLSLSRGENRNWLIENTLVYDNTFATDHKVTALLGQSAQRFKSYGFGASASDVPYSSEADLYLSLGRSTDRSVGDGGNISTALSYFGRVNYSFKDRYLLNVSLRGDAASQFYGKKLWGYFPSVGAGWVISNESFMQNQKVFTNLKLRGSWGKIGNAVVPINPSTLTVASGSNLTAIFNNQPYDGANVNSFVPPVINWETGVGIDVGLEASLLDSKLSFEADFYEKKTENAIFAIPILKSLGTGSGSILGNQADFRNRGFEFSTTWRDDFNKNLTYALSANFSINNNKVLSVLSGTNPIYSGGNGVTGGALATRTVLGRPIGEFYGYQVAGVFQNAAEVSSSAQTTAKPGDFKYVDQNNDGQIDGKDRVPLGNPNPKYAYGFNTNFGYKNFDLTLDFQGVAGIDVYNANIGFRYGNENFTKDFYDNRWRGEGTSNTYPSANIGGGKNYLPNSFFVESGSYFRVRNMQLGYTLPAVLSTKLKMQKLRLYANAQNALNFFKYKGFSPEIGGGPTDSGIDANVYPLYATYNFGVNLTF